MEEWKLVLADDDGDMRLIMKKMISRVEGFRLVGEAANGEDTLKLVEQFHPEVVFLDVEMPGMSGVECARQIQDLQPETVIVFATAHEGYMGEAFELYAFDYLLKPFRMERVVQTLERIRTTLSFQRAKPKVPAAPAVSVEGRMMLRHKEGVTFLDLKDIVLLQREDRSTVLYTSGGGRYETAETLAEMDERLPDSMFFRCHKSYIINLNHIREILPYGRWTYVVRLEGLEQDALITHEKYEELEKMFR